VNHEYLLAVLLDPLEKGEQFVRWPLHITLIPWFRTALPERQILFDIQAVCEAFEPFGARGVSREQFGWRGTRAVTALASPDLHDLHRALLERLKNGPYQLQQDKHIGDSFQPHVTKKGNAELKPGHEIAVDRIYLVKAPLKNPRTRTKTIVSSIEL
jgi:2'-5' RNA ligase